MGLHLKGSTSSSFFQVTVFVFLLIGLQLFGSVSKGSSDILKETLNGNSVVVFYNLFCKSTSDVARVSKIAREQFQWLISGVHRHVYVSSIGVHLPSLSNLTTASSKIVLRRKEESGDEVITLQELWSYCHERPFEKVVYLHSKGSFHPGRQNARLRRALSLSALSRDCAELPQQCNVCSMRMSPFPHAHTPGNMWLARCSYVKKLLEPEAFLRAMGSSDNPYFGSGRYAAEHWIHSHPSVNPCDLYSNSKFVYETKGIPSIEDLEHHFNISMAPRFTPDVYLYYHRDGRDLKRYPSYLKRLEEYERLYGVKNPPPEWWGWKFFNVSKDIESPPLGWWGWKFFNVTNHVRSFPPCLITGQEPIVK